MGHLKKCLFKGVPEERGLNIKMDRGIKKESKGDKKGVKNLARTGNR